MPRVRRLTPRRRVPEVDPAVVELLLTGGGGNIRLRRKAEFGFGPSPKDLAAAWAQHRDELLEDHVAERPGTRPAAWWTLEAPEPRRKVGGGSGLPRQGTQFHRGIALDWHPTGEPRSWWSPIPEFGTFSVDPADPPVMESEAAYLARLGLLADEERAQLDEADFAPVRLTATPVPVPLDGGSR